MDLEFVWHNGIHMFRINSEKQNLIKLKSRIAKHLQLKNKIQHSK